jgi:hypothetical protein
VHQRVTVEKDLQVTAGLFLCLVLTRKFVTAHTINP